MTAGERKWHWEVWIVEYGNNSEEQKTTTKTVDTVFFFLALWVPLQAVEFKPLIQHGPRFTYVWSFAQSLSHFFFHKYFSVSVASAKMSTVALWYCFIIADAWHSVAKWWTIYNMQLSQWDRSMDKWIHRWTVGLILMQTKVICTTLSQYHVN